MKSGNGFITVGFALLAALQLFGQQPRVEFTEVANSSQGFSSFGTFPAINNRGEVAFRAVQSGVGEGVFRSGPGTAGFTTIASVKDGLKFFGDDAAINSAGTVAFGATTVSGSRAIFKGDGAVRTLIADSAVNGLFKLAVGAPSINAAGVVAFSSPLAQPGLPAAVFVGSGGPLSIVAATSKTGFASFQNVGINGPGTVVFAAQSTDGSQGLFTVPGPAGGLVNTNQYPGIDSFGDPVINDSGTAADVVFVAPTGAPLIVTANVRGLTPRNNPANPAFASVEHPSLNSRGGIAFSAISISAGDGAPTGIYLEASGGQQLVPVVRPGDLLFGSVVEVVDLGRFALNDRFQLAFSYVLTDGRSGIAIASFHGDPQGGTQ